MSVRRCDPGLSVVAIFASLLMGTGCGITIEPLPPVKTASPTAQQILSIEQASGLVVPASARPIFFLEQNGMDQSLELHFELPAADLEAFLASPQLENARDLDPDPSRRRLQAQLPSAEALNVNFDEEFEDTVLIKMQWFET